MPSIKELMNNIDMNGEVSLHLNALHSNSSIEDFNALFEEYNCSWSDEFSDKVRYHWIPGATWICTDTQVGAALVSYDGNFVALMTQTGRKSNKQFKFFSEEYFYSLRSFHAKFKDNRYSPKPELIDINSEIHPSWFAKK